MPAFASRPSFIVAVALAVGLGLRWVLDPWLGPQLPLITLFAAVALAAALGGIGATLVVTLVGYLVARWLFIEPRGSLVVVPSEYGRLTLYVFASFVIGGFGEWMRRTVQRSEQARKLAEKEAARRADAEARFRLAADAVNGVIYEYDFRTRKVERTRGMFEVLGYRPEDVPPMPDWWDNQVHPDDRASRKKQFFDGAAAGERHFVLRYRMRHQDGRWLHVEDRAVLVVDERGEFFKLHGCTVDVTEMRQAEEQMRKLNAGLRDADRRKDEFVATLAHELRNPLAPIRNAVRILQAKGPPDTELVWARAVIERQAAHMSRLLEDLLDVSRITQGKLELRRTLVTLSNVIEAAIETSRPAIETGAHKIEVVLPDVPVQLEADAVRLAQVFANLLTNAAKYTEQGGRITVTVRQEGNEAVVSVRDTGIGIAPEMLGKLFEMYTQAVPAIARAQGGLGIGLSLVRGLVELHGGRVEARSEGTQKGSEFIVRLPLPVPQAGDTSFVQAASGPMMRLSRRVLVVDDNHDSADTLSTLLQVLGCEVAVAYDGAEGVDKAREFKPDAVLLDLGMPVLNGFEACERMRSEPWGKNICIVAVTGWGQDEDRRRTKEAGFDAHMVKPADPGKLTELLASISIKHPRETA
ncbi:MAG TPA: ATP-binding protein [Ramlibacter sp.]|nr:ATP-binding protein [Ramlibacter sp.]